MSFLKAETMPLVSFVFPIAPFTVLSREWAYSICCGMTSWVIPPWLGLRLNSLTWNSPNHPRTGILHLACWLLLSTCYLKWFPSASFCLRCQGLASANDALTVCVPGKPTDTRTDLGESKISSWPCDMAGWQEDSAAGRGKAEADQRDCSSRLRPLHVPRSFQLCLLSTSLATLPMDFTFNCERSFHSAIKRLFWFLTFHQLSCLSMSLSRLSQIMTITVEGISR